MDSVVMSLLVWDLTASELQVALLFVFRWTPLLLFALFLRHGRRPGQPLAGYRHGPGFS